VDNLHKVDAWLAALLANLEPAARQRMMRELAQELRRNQQNNIRLQRNPDGSVSSVEAVPEPDEPEEMWTVKRG